MSEQEIQNAGGRAPSNNIRRKGRFVTALLLNALPLETSTQTPGVQKNPFEVFDLTDAEDVTVHVWCDQKTGNFKHCVKLSSSFDGLTFGKISHTFWNPDAADYKIGLCSDRTAIGRLGRIEFSYESQDGSPAKAIVSVLLVIKYHLP